MHAEVLVQHVQPVEVDVDHAVVLLQRRGRQHRQRALLERGAREQPRGRIVRIHQDVGDATAEQLDDAHLAQVEVRRVHALEQHEHAVHALRTVHHGTREDLVRDVGERARVRGRVGRHGLAMELRPPQHLAMRAREDLRAHARWRVAGRAAHRDVLVRNQQGAHGAAEMVDATLHELGEVVRGIAAVGFFMRRAEQQLEVAVAHDEAALQVADARLRGELALEALQRGTQQALHQREGPRFAARLAAHHADAADHLARGVAQYEKIGDLFAGQRLGEARAHGATLRLLGSAGLLQQHFEVGLVALVHPDGNAHAVVDRDGMRARQQHLEQLPIRVERCAPGRSRRVGEQVCGQCHRVRPSLWPRI